jgi:putative redox protein
MVWERVDARTLAENSDSVVEGGTIFFQVYSALYFYYEERAEMPKVIVESVANLEQRIIAGKHVLVADEPDEACGGDAGPDPYQYLLAALGSCTSMTLQLYARRKGIALQKVVVELESRRVHGEDCRDCETQDGFITEISREIRLEGTFTDEQRNRLLEIATRCPVHRSLTGEIKIRDISTPIPSDKLS